MKTKYFKIILLLSFFVSLSSCKTDKKESSKESMLEEMNSMSKYIVFEKYDSIISKDKTNTGFQDFESYQSMFDTINIDGIKFFITEGDLLLDIDELQINYYTEDKPKDNEKLVGIIREGEILRIDNPKNIKFSIIKESFTEEEYLDIVRYFNQATSDWKRVCNVDFKHISELDNQLRSTDNPSELSFVVRKIGNSSGGLIASAFFPYDPKYKRKVLITPKFFTTSFSKTGVLRHEIGHILGFRHEHIRSGAPAVCPNESLDETLDLTKYDPKSVMHYFCGGVGTKELKITTIDSIGASKIYK